MTQRASMLVKGCAGNVAEDGLRAGVSNSQTVRVHPLQCQGINGSGQRTCRGCCREAMVKLGGITVLPSHVGQGAFFIVCKRQILSGFPCYSLEMRRIFHAYQNH